ncbi:hypothetical protein N7456_000527 [Penicillium angulare]|uniref:F-box domain-containing protein n=1 Tax=Penicillium angulare TaxID=116970 RepID=A0A9W9KSA9_9EURO|nr:hypothetical protein N7456_000527 [Penicillium angulare]
MLMLPEEILACILNSTMSYTTFCGHNVSFSESTIWALARTCHHLYRIAIPLIYRNLRLRFSQRILRPACSSGNLLRTLNADPSLATFCYDLGLVVFDACPARCEADFKKFEYFLPWFKNVKVLHLEANFDRNSRGASWRFIQRCAQRMPRLESLFLKGRNWAAPSIPDVLQQIQIPTLRELTVDGKSTSDLTLEMPKVSIPLYHFEYRKFIDKIVEF